MRIIKQKKIKYSEVGVIVLLTYSFFIGLITRYLTAGLQIAILLLGLVTFSARNKIKLRKQLMTLVISIACIFIILLNRNARFSSGFYRLDVCIVIGIIVYCLACNMNKWHKCYYKYLVLMGVFYGVTTIFLFLFPQIYFRYVAPLFSTSDVMYEYVQKGYVVGFSSHFSTTTIYLSIAASAAIIPFLRKETFENSTKKMLILLFAIVYASILLTGKRAHSIFVIIAGVVVYWFMNKDKKLGRFFYLISGLSFFALVFFIAAQFFPPLYNVINRFESKINNENLLSGREVMVYECVNMFRTNPMFGTGWGSFTYYTDSDVLDAHNVYIQLLAENGILLSIPFFCFFFVNYIYIVKSVMRMGSLGLLKNNWETVMVGSSLFLQTFFLLYCLTGNPIYDVQFFLPYIFSCAIGEYYYRSFVLLTS